MSDCLSPDPVPVSELKAGDLVRIITRYPAFSYLSGWARVTRAAKVRAGMRDWIDIRAEGSFLGDRIESWHLAQNPLSDEGLVKIIRYIADEA